MKKIKIFLLATIVLLAGCEDFLDINRSPNDATEPDIDKLLPGIMYDIGDDFSIGYAKLGYACAVYSHQMVTRQPEYDDYNINGYSYAVDTYWADLYAGPAEDLKLLIRMGEESDNLIYAGIAKIIKAYLFSMMVDLWAELPYTEANTEGITKPVFDDGEQIYAALFTLIDEGIANIQNTDAENIRVPGDDDLIYGGDTDQWIRMANTLKLKMYNQVRLVSMYSQGAVDQLLADPDNNLIGPGDDFMLPFGTSVAPENRHPAFVSEYGGSQISNYISPWFFEILSGYNANIHTGITDPRIPYYWCNQLAGGDPENPPEYKDGDFNTIMFGSVGPNRDHAGRASFTMMGIYPCGGTFDDGVQVGPLGSLDGTGAAPQRFITYADRLYIEAEMMQVGRVAGDARAKLEEAIYASFEQVDMVVDMVGPDQDVPVLAGSGMDTAYVTAVLAEYDAGDAEKKLEIVLTQKWISQWGNSMDQYTDYRRTGYPVRFDANSNGGSQYQGPDGTAPIPTQETRAFPLSFPYDKDEVILNNNCTQKIVSQSPVFWDE
jgi:hypothetical protein